MKKVSLVFLTLSLFYLLFPQLSFGASPIESVFGTVNPPSQISGIGQGGAGISNVLNKVIQLIFIVGTIGFVFMIVISAVQWIFSGGDKEAVGKARGRLTYAIIGLIILALAFVIIGTIGRITGFTMFSGQAR